MSKRIHILYTIPNFDTAGSGKVVYDLAHALDKKRFRVSIACRHNRGAFFKEVEALGVQIYIIDVAVPLRPYYSLLNRVNRFKELLKKEKVDIVHSWNWSSNWTEILSCRMARVKFLYTKKAMGWGNKHWKIRSYLSHFIVTVNTDMRAFFSYKTQQQLIPFGLDTDYYSPKRYPEKGEYYLLRIITVANLVPVKGIEVLLKAIKSLNHLPLILDVVGDTRDPYAQVLMEMTTALKIEDRVTFSGKQADIRASLVASDLYVIPSEQEGMPMALVEAMSMAVPVLGSDVSGIRYVLQQFPNLLFPVSDHLALAKKIEVIYKMTFEERKVLGLNLREYCKNQFSMKTFIDRHENLYLNLLKRDLN